MNACLRSLIVAASLLTATGALAEGDAALGEKVFKRCVACHKVGPDAKNSAGPVLNGIVGRPAGTAKDFAYSQLNLNAGANGLVWTEELLFAYLADPSKFLAGFLTEKGKADLVVGKSKMVFKLANETERRNLVAYLATLPAQ